MDYPIVTLTEEEGSVLSNLYINNQDEINILYNYDDKKITPQITAKLLRKGKQTIIASFKKVSSDLEITCSCETPIFSMTPPNFAPFTFVVQALSDPLKILKMPKDRKAKGFLFEKNADGIQNINSLMILYTASHVLVDIVPELAIIKGSTYRPVPNFKNVVTKYLDDKLLMIRNDVMLFGWDTITLNHKQMDKLEQIFKDKQIDLDFVHYAIEKFCFVNYDEKEKKKYYYFYTLEKGKLHCEFKASSSLQEIEFDATFKPTASPLDFEATIICNERDKEILERQIKDSDKKNWQWIVQIFFFINTLILNYGDVSFDIEEKIATTPSQNKSHKKQDRNTSRLFKSYTLKKTWASAIARKHTEITCPCWGVRGHFRHYKNGKVVFIEPFMKGKEKDQYKGKEYALMPYKEA